MIIYKLLVFAFGFLCVLMTFLILMQKGKSSLGFGGLGGGTQLLFGGSGGQDLFQKITWGMGALFIGGALLLAVIKRPTSSRVIGSFTQHQKALQETLQIPATQPTAATAQSDTTDVPTQAAKPEEPVQA